MRWAGEAGGEVEVTILCAPTAPPDHQPASALLACSVGIALGILRVGGEPGAGAADLRVGPLSAELRVHLTTASVREAVELRLEGGSPE
eukprot:1240734-Pleurochrysis_carterae.AAC.1